jgi:hypothetical protein
MGLLDEVVGTLLIGTWLNGLLFAFELTQLWTYFTRFPTDRPVIRGLVVAMFAIDLTATANMCAMVYLVCNYSLGTIGDFYS